MPEVHYDCVPLLGWLRVRGEFKMRPVVDEAAKTAAEILAANGVGRSSLWTLIIRPHRINTVMKMRERIAGRDDDSISLAGED